jgi:hypothetical protein
MAKRKPIVQKYYLHFDKKTGVITTVSNEPTLKNEGSLEVPFEDYRAFTEGEKQVKDYIIGNVKGDDGKKVRSLIKIRESMYGFRTNEFEWINDTPKSNTELTVQWNNAEQSWIFSLSNKAKIRLQDEVKRSTFNKSIFFVMLKDDFDFLIRDIVVDINDLINNPIKVPFESKLETDSSKISMSTKIHFHSYGLIINDN